MIEMFNDHEYVQKYPHDGDSINYFPTVSLQNSIEFDKVKVDESKRGIDFEIVELMLSYNQLTIQDDPTALYSARTTNFLNIASHRKVLGESYKFADGDDRTIIKMYSFMIS